MVWEEFTQWLQELQTVKAAMKPASVHLKGANLLCESSKNSAKNLRLVYEAHIFQSVCHVILYVKIVHTALQYAIYADYFWT